MEKVTLFLFLIIVMYLAYSFIKSRKKYTEKQAEQIEQRKDSANKESDNEYDYYKKAVAAAVAAVMSGKTYRINTIFEAQVDEKKPSAWKVAGRQESMIQRSFFRKL